MLNTRNAKPKKVLYIDFEYNGTSEAKLNLVCASVYFEKQTTNYWLYDHSDTKKLKDLLLSVRDTAAICCFNVTAEAHAFLSLGLNELNFFWLDLQAEWRMMINCNDKYAHGKQLIKGKVKKTYPKEGYDEDDLDHSKPESNLAACAYKLLDVQIDTKRKDEIRRLIISDRNIEAHKKEIMEYCESDVKYLPQIWVKIKEFYKTGIVSKNSENILDEILWRGESVARTSRMMALGYPVNLEACKTFYGNVPSLLLEIENEINTLFPDITPFEFNKKTKRNVKKVKSITDWISKTQFAKDWLRTDKGAYSTALEAFEKHFHYRHSYPTTCFGAQMLRYLRYRQSLSGFIPKAVGANSESFFDFIGSDSRSRVWLNPYGAKTSRYQPKSKGFLFLKAAWMRALCMPQKGSVICGIDYSSQEFLIAALLSEDKNMLDAYASGDVYLYFAKLSKAVPQDGTKDQYKKERDLFKATTLGLSYGMAAKALAVKLEQDTGVAHTRDDAQLLIDKFYKAYPAYAKWREKILHTYDLKRHLKLKDGWYIFGDGNNERSTQNFPVQGMGGAILRRAVQMCQDAGINAIFPLHDALFCEFPYENYLSTVDAFAHYMREAFLYYFADKEKANLIRVDVNVWGPDLKNETLTTPLGNKIKTQDKYIDPRSIEDYEKFSKYFN